MPSAGQRYSAELYLAGAYYADGRPEHRRTHERIHLTRRPTNPYDANAIEIVHTESNVMQRYVSREQAAWLAPLLDRGALELVEGEFIGVRFDGVDCVFEFIGDEDDEKTRSLLEKLIDARVLYTLEREEKNEDFDFRAPQRYDLPFD
jgi:hypothetical protein